MSDHRAPHTGHTESLPDDELLLAQVKAVLSPLPTVNRQQIAQILAATQHRRRTPWQRVSGRLEQALEWWRFSTPPLARGASLAAAALTIGFVARGYISQPRDASAPTPHAARTAAAPAAMAAPALTVNRAADAVAPQVPVQFLLDARDIPAAANVSVVGDFNEWSVSAAPLVLDNGVWSTTLPLAPGRHVYAFVVNGERWLADPRAPQATDADFGRPGSVIIVQAP
ncbi:isoamylase early set domain-containing protein [Gemmatimonas sp.]